MIKSVEFKNFRNLNKKYIFDENLNIVIGKNNSGKTNLLDGIKIAFSAITSDYFRISDSDFKESNPENIIEIKVELRSEKNIPSLMFFDEKGKSNYGFKVIITKTKSGRYVKKLSLLNGSNIDMDILREDNEIPNIYSIPILRIEDIYTAGLTTGLSNFINSEEKYKEIKEKSKEAIKDELKTKTDKFKKFCEKFNQNLEIDLTDPKLINEKVFIVDGKLEHNINIGSGYKSIANIIINTLNEKFNIILIDEVENHLHPSLIRTLIRELRSIKNTIIIGTTHSSVVINELNMEEVIDISSKKMNGIKSENLVKLNNFLHPGRNELMLADNVILVEGYTEELLLKNYLKDNNENWTVINVAGIMFEPYIDLCNLLSKKVVVVSDNDESLSNNKENSSRFNNLSTLCKKIGVKLIEVQNTLETDLYNNGFLVDFEDLLTTHSKHNDILIAKQKKKMNIVEKIITSKIDLKKWHVIEGIENEFRSN